VVFITSFQDGTDLFTLNPQEVPAGAGSGFFWTPNKIVTNYHVVKDAKQLKVTLGDGTVIDGAPPSLPFSIGTHPHSRLHSLGGRF
jgi:S1-C subfamily serine protease